MKDDVMSMPDHDNHSMVTVTPSDQMNPPISISLQQALAMIDELEEAVKTSNMLVHALLDGSANDKKIGKFILKTARQTDALLDRQTCKQLYTLLTNNIAQHHQSD
ncbi:MAG TPA: hypothetical protein VL987_00485 [Cellvibrio sp.]|nr:hypothetical protein [Cellvibrio sp.]